LKKCLSERGQRVQIQDPTEKSIKKTKLIEQMPFGAWPETPDPGSDRKINLLKRILNEKLPFGARPESRG